jgi:hypothetical protein
MSLAREIKERIAVIVGDAGGDAPFARRLTKEMPDEPVLPSTVQAWRGRPGVLPSAEALLRIADADQASLDWLLRGEGPRKRTERPAHLPLREALLAYVHARPGVLAEVEGRFPGFEFVGYEHMNPVIGDALLSFLLDRLAADFRELESFGADSARRLELIRDAMSQARGSERPMMALLRKLREQITRDAMPLPDTAWTRALQAAREAHGFGE